MTNASGKLVIIGILAIALAAAATSWWFRYSATSQVVKLWGPNTVRLIRDAPIVELYQLTSATEPPPPHQSFRGPVLADRHDISTARGLTHLRNALLEDRSYRWTESVPTAGVQWNRALLFRSSRAGDDALLCFSSDWKYVRSEVPAFVVVSCEPIAGGLATMFNELIAEKAPVR